MFSVKAQTKRTIPARPASVTLAISAEDQVGQPRLFVRRSGSDDDDPRQGKLATKDGHVIDIATGEVIEEPAG